MSQELTSGGDPEELKLSLVRGAGSGTVGAGLEKPTEDRFLPLCGPNTNLQSYDALRLQRKPASPTKQNEKSKRNQS